MGKGKKKKANKGKKRESKKSEDDTVGGGSSTLQISREHYERARLAAANRTEDPLKNWTRPQNEECPICMLPLPIIARETNYCVTCGKTVCWGCMVSTGIAHRRDGGDLEKATEKATTCPYCRSDIANKDFKYTLEHEMKRANAGNITAMYYLAHNHFHGEMGLQQDKAEALKWYHQAVEAGSGRAAFNLGSFYGSGDCVDQDIDKALEYFQKAAELGDMHAFALIGVILLTREEIEEGMLNLRKAAMCGDCGSFKTLRDGFSQGFITKDEYAFTLRENQKACNEMKSDGRDKIKVWLAQEKASR